MQKLKNTVRTCLMYAAVVMLAGGYPLTVLAQAPTETAPATAETTTTTEAPASTPAPSPTKKDPAYTYNPETKHWDTPNWKYNATSGKYERTTQAPAQTVAPLPLTEEAAKAHEIESDKTADSTTITDTTKNTIENNIGSTATTGDAKVRSNTTAGDATTGDATAIANLINSIDSSVGGDGAEFATFVTDIVGDVHGDIMLYPMLLKAMVDAAAAPSSDTTIKAKTTNEITNNVNLDAKTGDATVANNTNAGDATTGTANTVANVMNFINSIIAANQSFVGTVNIHGNLDGDILVAPDFLPQLLASNTSTSSAPASSLDVTSDNTQSIVNNIDLNAASGNATVANNTKAGNATTGDASTNVVLLNLSGHQVVASNSLLVFVNVLGTWVGIIVDAPTGATAAAIGNGVTSHSTGSDLTIGSETDSRITNNIALNSQSGDATVAGNTSAGNAASGNATASANIANISGSQLGLSDWFGILFINVFGSWHGSFGVDTERGTQPVTTSPKPGEKPDQSAPAPVFQFVAEKVAETLPLEITGSAQEFGAAEEVVVLHAEEVVDTEKKSPAVLGSTDTTPRGISAAMMPAETAGGVDVLPFAIATFMVGLGAIAIRNIVTFIRGRHL